VKIAPLLSSPGDHIEINNSVIRVELQRYA